MNGEDLRCGHPALSPRRKDVHFAGRPTGTKWRRFWTPNLFNTSCASDILPAFTGGRTVSDFTLRDRDRSQDVDSEHDFNINYEPEKDRCTRVEAANRSCVAMFDSNPRRLGTAAAHDLGSSTWLRTRAVRDHPHLADAFTTQPVNNICSPYAPMPALLDFRAEHVEKFVRPRKMGEGAKRLDYSLPRRGGFLPPALPNASVEPYLESSRWQICGRDPQDEVERRQAENDRASLAQRRCKATMARSTAKRS